LCGLFFLSEPSGLETDKYIIQFSTVEFESIFHHGNTVKRNQSAYVHKLFSYALIFFLVTVNYVDEIFTVFETKNGRKNIVKENNYKYT
jgi:hypothetical protein